MSIHSQLQKSASSLNSDARNLSYFESHQAHTNDQSSAYRNPLQQFSSFNEDFEMDAPLAQNSFFVVPDTNILLRYLDILASFAEDVEKSGARVVIIIPQAVVSELDWQKKDNWFSRKASLWIWKKIQEKKTLKGQGRTENLKDTGFTCHSNDDRIIECALYFAHMRPTVLCSADNNLCINAESQSDAETLAVMNPLDKKHSPWSSRVLGNFLFPQYKEKFTDWKPAYTNESEVVVDTTRQDDEMEIDNPGELNDQLYQSDARDSLHGQVIEVFVGLLRALVASHQKEHRMKTKAGASASMHAPAVFASVHALELDENPYEMTVEVLLAYVERRCPRPLVLPRENPYLTSFLSKPYIAHSGGRKGSEWSTQDWLISLRKLQIIGKAWGDRGEDIVNTLRFDLVSHLQRVFGDDDLQI